ncbi:YgzB family protein, partial [Escherichia coli]|nr:YgzB family protein [Escherichia coli]
LHFAPGTKSLKCAYCGAVNEIEQQVAETASDGGVRSFPYETFIEQLESLVATTEACVVSCPGCGASTTLPPNVTADACPFCATPL